MSDLNTIAIAVFAVWGGIFLYCFYMDRKLKTLIKTQK
jgi:CcmD family protein